MDDTSGVTAEISDPTVDNNSVNSHTNEHLSVVDRYYTRKYMIDINGCPSHDQCVLLHSNKLCVVTVAKSHPVLSESRKIKSVNFQLGGGVNRMENKVSGKGKKGAQKLKPDSPICSVTCEDGQTFTFVSCVRGMLLEVNENLIESPNLITEKSETNGYLAIILPVLKEYTATVSSLINEEAYRQTIQQRQGISRHDQPG